MSSEFETIDLMLAAALRDDRAVDDRHFTGQPDAGVLVERINYHGIAGLLGERLDTLTGWPIEVTTTIRNSAIAQAMWELRHRQILSELLAAFASAGVVAILLKGTALAYDLYHTPATRGRGDSDVLVDPRQLAAARRILDQHGFVRISGDEDRDDEFSLQEVWSRTSDDTGEHPVDLHWQLLNAPALADVLTAGECAADPRPLPRLSPTALTMDRVATLIHTCIHRTLHFASPYFVDGRTYYDGDRLIWLHDIDLLARALSADEWARFCDKAEQKGVAAPCLDGLVTAQRFFATALPRAVLAALAAASGGSRPNAYLGARQLGRAWQDLQTIPGFRRKLRYVRARTLPSRAFIRSKYPRLSGLPLPLLYARRLVDLLRVRPERSGD